MRPRPPSLDWSALLSCALTIGLASCSVQSQGTGDETGTRDAAPGVGGATGAAGMNGAGGATGAGGALGTGGAGAAGIGGALGTGGAGAAGTGGKTGAVGVGGRGGAGAGTGGRSGSGGAVGAGGGAGAGGRTGSGGSTGTDGGAAMAPYKGIASYNGCTDLALLNLSWYYTWSASTNCTANNAVFVPQLWGHASENLAGELTAAATKGYPAILGFNEPDNSTQSNMSVAAAIALWPQLTTNSSIRVGSPATQANSTGQAWFTSFMSMVNADTTGTLRVDFIALHWYGWNAGSCEANASTFESYIKWAEAIPGNRPIWITEWACMHDSDPDAATVQTFLKGAIAMLAKHPRVERYGWYLTRSSDVNNLVDSTGALTSVGTVYADAPSTK